MWASLSRKRRTASAFTSSDWKILAEAYFILLLARLQVVINARRALAGALAKGSGTSVRAGRRCSKARLLVLMGIASRYQGARPDCLPVSLAQHHLLLRHGFSLPLQIGVRRQNGQLQAHAWCRGAEPAALWEPLEQGEKQA